MFEFKGPDLSKLDWSLSDSNRLQRRMGDGFEDAASQVAARVQAAAPERTGALAASVRVEREGDRVAIKAGGTADTITRTRKGEIYDEAVLVEYGTGRQAAQPFFYDTASGGEAEFRDAAEHVMSEPRKG